MEPIRPLIIPGGGATHPLAGLRRPAPIVVILVGVLVAMGWSDGQIIALLAVLLPAVGTSQEA